LRNYLKYLSDTMYSAQSRYNLTDNQLKFLLFISDEKGSFTKKSVRQSFTASATFFNSKFPDLVKRDFIFVFDKRSWDSHLPNQYRVTNKTKRLINKFYNALEGQEEF